MKISIKFLLSALALVIVLASCKKPSTVIATAVSTAPTVAHGITKDTLYGTIKGTMVKNHTYYVTADVIVNKGDTLNIQEGVNIIMLNPDTTHLSGISFYIKGVLIVNGTQGNMVNFTIPANKINTSAPNKSCASWGGIEGDSSLYLEIHFANILYGGAKGDGKVSLGGTPQLGTNYAVSCKSGGTLILEDSRIAYYGNDGIRTENGVKATILRNTFEYIGLTGGEAINIKTGTTGDFAYNVIWSSATNALKFNTSSPVILPETNVNVYNNTVVNNGFRNPAKPGNGVLFDLFTSGNVYNNIFVNCKQGLRITKGATGADLTNTHYGNNLFFCTDTSLKAGFYPAGDAGTVQTTDLFMVDPKFVILDKNISNVLNLNDVHLQSGSPCIGAGNKTYNADLGAYTSDGQGHK